jgi:signal transduction histidine kinase
MVRSGDSPIMPLKILLIEDNPDHIEITKWNLKKASGDYQLDFAMDPKEGLKKIFEGAYDAVLCDYRLPGLTAFDILKQMNAKHNDTPLIVVTAMGNEKVAVDMMKEGAYDYIVKDVSYIDTLDVVIRKTLDRHKAKKEKAELEEKIRKAYIELKETQKQLIQAAKLGAIGQLASGVAHEVRNPLGIILQGVNFLEKRISSEEKDIFEILVMLKDNVKRADKILGALLDFSRAESLELQPEDMNSIIEVSISLVKARSKFENIDFVMEKKEGMPLTFADKNKMEQAFINIFFNAIQAMSSGGKIIVRTYDKILDHVRRGVGRREEDCFLVGERAIIVEIEDTGCGISEENLTKIFDPFFSTKGPTKGTGLGLSVTRNIITTHKGLIDIESQVGKGTRVILTLKAIDTSKRGGKDG